MSDLSIPILLGGIGMLFVALVVVLLLVTRQVLVSRSRGAFECTVRRRGPGGRASWRPGLLRFGTARRRWFRAFSLRLRPEVALRRSELRDVTRQRLPAQVAGGEERSLAASSLHGDREVSAIVDL